MVEAADLYVLVGGDLVKLANFEAVGQNQFEAALRSGSGLAAELFDGLEVRQLYQIASDQNVQIRRLNHKRDSLEDIFLKAMETADGRL